MEIRPLLETTFFRLLHSNAFLGFAKFLTNGPNFWEKRFERIQKAQGLQKSSFLRYLNKLLCIYCSPVFSQMKNTFI